MKEKKRKREREKERRKKDRLYGGRLDLCSAMVAVVGRMGGGVLFIFPGLRVQSQHGSLITYVELLLGLLVL